MGKSKIEYMKNTLRFAITIAILELLNLNNLNSQWLKEQDFRNAKKTLVELYGVEKFGFMPDVDTTALKQIRKEVQMWQTLFENCIDTLTKPKPNFEKIKVIAGLNKDQIKEIQNENMRTSNKESSWHEHQTEAIGRLAYYPYNYSKLNNYSQLLIPIVRQYINNFNDETSYKIAAHLNLPVTFKDSLIKGNKTPLMVKARLGDTIAERTIIEKFTRFAFDTLTNDSLPAYTQMLFFINSKKTLSAYFDALQTYHAQRYYFKLYNDPEVFCRWYSLAYRLLLAYQSYYPFEIRYFEKFIFNHPNIPDDQETSVYYEAVSKYLSKKFKKNIKIRTYYMGAGTLIPMDVDIIPLNATLKKK